MTNHTNLIGNRYNTGTAALQAAWAEGFRCQTTNNLNLMTHHITGEQIRFVRDRIIGATMIAKA